MLCIGLFGTCDKNPWRDDFMVKYRSWGYDFFNPMVDDWHPGLVATEAKHLAEDDIVLFPILGWSYGVGSLSELGFGPLRALRQNKNRSFVFYIETELHERLTDPDRRKDSFNARKLVLGHLREINAPNIYLVNSLDQMLDTSCTLYEVHKRLNETQERLGRLVAG